MLDPSDAIAAMYAVVGVDSGLKSVISMLPPPIPGANGTIRLSDPAADGTVSKLPVASAIVATTDSGLALLIRTEPEKDDNPNDAAVKRSCVPAAMPMGLISANCNVLESSRVMSGVANRLLKLAMTSSDPGLSLNRGMTYRKVCVVD